MASRDETTAMRLLRMLRWLQGGRRLFVRFSATLALNDELLNWFLGFGPEVEIMEPEWFRERLAEKARLTAVKYL